MSRMFREDLPIARQWEREYLRMWGELSPEFRDRLRRSDARLRDDERHELNRLSYPAYAVMMTEINGRDVPDIHPLFAEWAQREAPSEEDLPAALKQLY